MGQVIQFPTKKLPPQPDFEVENHGSVYILTAYTPAAEQWAETYLPEDCATWGAHGTVIEHRYIGDIVEGIMNDGLVVS